MLGIHDTDKEWRKWGEADPYYAVLSDEKYRGQQNLANFFKSGEQHFEVIKGRFEELGLPLLKAGSALDFGCGVGRVLRPMAVYFDKASGLDVAPGMLEQARKNIAAANVQFLRFDGQTIPPEIAAQPIDFVHSTLVFQHIRPRRGLRIIESLMQHLSDQGKAYLQVPIHAERKILYAVNQIITSHPFILKVSRRILHKKQIAEDPVMQMNVYPVDRLLKLFTRQRIAVRYIELIEDRKNNLLHAGWYLCRHQ